MKPYPFSFANVFKSAIFTLLIVFATEPALAYAGSRSDKIDFDSLTRSGFDHYYSLEYDQAIRDFQKAWEARPDEPNALNHLLEAKLFQELYRYNALDTRLYTRQRFLTSKHVPIDPEVKNQLLQLVQRALAASDKRLRSDPRDVQALYSRGVTEGLYSTYLAVAEHSFWQALRHARAARSDHEEVLKLQPGFADAKTLVGAHEYVVGSLSAPVKVMVGIVGIRGDKNKGLRMLAEAGKDAPESGTDAKVSLALFFRREERYQEALEVIRSLARDRPHNFLFALEEGNLLRDAGHGPESIASYRSLLSGCKEGRYPGAHTEVAQLALGEALRGQNQLPEALEAYQAAMATSAYDPDLHQRALLGAGEVSDLLTKRDQAVAEYRAAIALDASTEEADTARKHLARPYDGH
jgi:tetratricopeptide (TPR) repeat protein